MFKNLLLAIDGSDPSRRAIRHALVLAQALGAQVTVLTVTIPWSAQFARELAVVVPDAIVPKTEYDHKSEVAAACILQDVAADARSAGVAVRVLQRSHPNPYLAIVETAERERCDLIITGSHQSPDFTGALLGSEAMKVLAKATVPVLVCRDRDA